MQAILPFSDEQARALINLRQRYEVWIDAERALHRLPYDLRRKTVGGHDYLYEIRDRSGNGRSLGRWDEDKAARFADFRAAKAELKQRRQTVRQRLDESSRLARALRLPQLSAPAGSILREADRRELLGSHLLVIGTNCMAAYAQEAGGIIVDAADETEDFDLAWVAPDHAEDRPFWDMLKTVDPTYSINSERDFQARNAAAYEVELLVAPSLAQTVSAGDRPRPVCLPEQEWLLPGRRVDQVVACRDGTPARILAPDPRWFALHKLWLAEKPGRHPLKRGKDRRQGAALLATVAEAMPHYPLDEAFAATIPAELRALWQLWRNG